MLIAHAYHYPVATLGKANVKVARVMLVAFIQPFSLTVILALSIAFICRAWVSTFCLPLPD